MYGNGIAVVKYCVCFSFGKYGFVLTIKFLYLTETPRSKLFFTTSGEKPNPFNLKIGGREITFKYRGPFTLKPGKRMVKAIAIARY